MLGQTEDHVRARRAEIEARYQWHDRQQRATRRARPSRCALRLGELYRFANDRWGPGTLPSYDDDNYVRRYILVVANTLAGLPGDPKRRVTDFVVRAAPWMDRDEIGQIVELTTTNPASYSADSVAFNIGLDAATRERLQIRTIGAIDLLKPQRDALRRKKARDRERARRLRIREEKPKRVTLTSMEPWKAAGVSRATYYRNREQFDAQLLPAKEIWKWKNQ